MLLTVVCKALIVKDGKVLLMRLGPKGGSTQLAGTFDLPGGRLRAGESFAEVLQRELWEECGFELPATGAGMATPVFVDDVRLPGGTGVGKVYEPAQAIRLTFRLDPTALGFDANKLTLGYEHDDHIWVAPHDARELLLFPGIGEVLAKAGI